MTLKEDIKKILDDYQPRTPSEITKELKKEQAVKSGVNYVSTLLREIVEESNQYFLLQDKVYQKRKNTIDLYIDGISLQKLLQDTEIEISIKLK